MCATACVCERFCFAGRTWALPVCVAVSALCVQLDVPFRVRAVGVENLCGIKGGKLRLGFLLTSGGYVMDRSRLVTSAVDAVRQVWEGPDGPTVTHSARWPDGYLASECSVNTLTVVRRPAPGRSSHPLSSHPPTHPPPTPHTRVCFPRPAQARINPPCASRPRCAVLCCLVLCGVLLCGRCCVLCAMCALRAACHVL
jgi:hypothetical protein